MNERSQTFNNDGMNIFVDATIMNILEKSKFEQIINHAYKVIKDLIRQQTLAAFSNHEREMKKNMRDLWLYWHIKKI